MIPRRYTLGYFFVGVFYLAFFVWFESPQIGFIDAAGFISGRMEWVVFSVGFGYTVLTSISLNRRITQRACERGSPESRLVILSLGWVLYPGSMGFMIYVLTGNAYMTIPFNVLMLLSSPYYYWSLIRILANRNAIPTEL